MAMSICEICKSKINIDEDKYLTTPEGFVHLDCWVTRMFRLKGINKEAFGALSMAIDYLLSSRLLLREVSKIEENVKFEDKILTLIKDIDMEISKLLDIIYNYIIKK